MQYYLDRFGEFRQRHTFLDIQTTPADYQHITPDISRMHIRHAAYCRVALPMPRLSLSHRYINIIYLSAAKFIGAGKPLARLPVDEMRRNYALP